MARMQSYNRDLLVWVDETGSDRQDTYENMGMLFVASTQCVTACLKEVPMHVSAIAAMSRDGIIVLVNGDIFLDFVRGSLIPIMQEYDGMASRSIVIMDNLSVHHVSEVVQHFRQAGIVVLFLPLYSPDLDPLEELLSCVKYYLKKHDVLLQAVDNPID